MFRLILSSLPDLWRQQGCALVSFAAIVAFLAILGLTARVPLVFINTLVFTVGAVTVAIDATMFLLVRVRDFYNYGLPIVHFGRATRQFRTAVAGPIILRYAPELHGRFDIEGFLKRGNETYADLSEKFGLTLRRRLVIFLFPTGTSLSRAVGDTCGGCALVGGDALCVAVESDSLGNLEEVVIHEMVHLFSAYLGDLNPPFKGEGLATWLMGTIDGNPIDSHALVALLAGRYWSLVSLATLADIHEAANSYVFAGSFTGDLIHRFGWDRYRDFFRLANGKNFDSIFAQIFGVSLLRAEQQWHEDLVRRRQTFEPDLSTLIAEGSAVSAYEVGHVYPCLQEIDALLHTDKTNGMLLEYAAAIHRCFGHYDQALHFLEHSIRTDDPRYRTWRSDSWLRLGKLCDLVGNRNEAEQAYKRALSEPDYGPDLADSSHASAQRFLKTPYSEQDLQIELRGPVKTSRRRKTAKRAAGFIPAAAPADAPRIH